MSKVLKIIGGVIGIIGFIALMATEYASVNETIESGSIVPTQENFQKTMILAVGEIIFIAFGIVIFVIGIKLCSSSSN